MEFVSGWRHVRHIERYERRLPIDHKERHPRRQRRIHLQDQQADGQDRDGSNRSRYVLIYLIALLADLSKTVTYLFRAEYPYKFVKVLKSQQLVEKETLTLVCELDDAGGEVKWFKGDQEIVADKR